MATTLHQVVPHQAVLGSVFSSLQASIKSGIERNFQGQTAIETNKKSKKTLFDEVDKRLWCSFPRNTAGYEPSILALGKLSRDCLEDTVMLVLNWLPYHSKAFSEVNKAEMSASYGLGTPYNFDTFISKLSGFDRSDPRRWDLVECAVDLACADLLSYALFNYTGDNLKAAHARTIKDLALFQFKPRAPRFPTHAPLWDTLRADISQQWSQILSMLSRLGQDLDLSELLRTANGASPVDAAAYYRGYGDLCFNVKTPGSVSQVQIFLDQLLQFVDSNKNKTVRTLQIETLDTALHSIDFSDNLDGISDKAKAIYQKASAKWIKSDDMESVSIRLMATILSHGPFSFFEVELDSFLKRLLKGVWAASKDHKKRDAYLDAILRILRGKYGGASQGWVPKSNINFDEVLFKPPSPYSYLGMADNTKRMTERVKQITLGLFPKDKALLQKSQDGVDLFVDIVLQIASHSMLFVRESIFPILFSDRSKIPVYQLIGVRCLRLIMDSKSGWWDSAGWNPDNPNPRGAPHLLQHLAQDHTVPRDQLMKIYETTLMKLIQVSEANAGFEAMGRDANILPVTSYLAAHEIVLLHVAPAEESDTDEQKRRTQTVRESVDRWNDVVGKTSHSRESDASKAVITSTNAVHDVVNAWCSHSRINSPLEHDTAEAADDVAAAGSTPHHDKVPSSTTALFLELYKECVRSIPIVLPENIVDNLSESAAFFGLLLVHNDVDLATVCSHSLQQIVVEHPEHRTAVLQGMISLSQQYKNMHNAIETTGLQTVLSQMLLIVDLWNSLKYADPIDGSDPSNAPPQNVVDDVYAVGFLFLCHPSPRIRTLSLSLIRAISATNPDAEKGLAHVIEQREVAIMERARHAYLRDWLNGVDTIKLSTTTKTMTIADVAGSHVVDFWKYVVAEIGRECVSENLSLGSIRATLLSNLAHLQAPPSTTEAADALPHSYRDVRSNYLAAVFSVIGRTPSDDNNPSAYNEFLEQFKNFCYSIDKKGRSESGLWSSLLHDSAWVRNQVFVAASCTHWCGVETVAASLTTWFGGVASKKHKSRMRITLASVLRHILQSHQAPSAMAQSESLVQLTVQFLKEFGAAIKLIMATKNGNEQYFIDATLTAKHFCASYYTLRPKSCPKEGPLRVYLTGSLPSDVVSSWSADERSKLWQQIVQWSSELPTDASQVDVSKLQVAQTPRRRFHREKATKPSVEDERQRYGKLLKDMQLCARLAAEQIARVDMLFPEGERKIESDTLNWVIGAEHKGHHILRWLLSFHFVDVFKLFNDLAYNRQYKDSALFAAALFDQFLPLVDARAPSTGVDSEVERYQDQRAAELKDALCMQSHSVAEADVVFAGLVAERAGSILFMALFHTVHPSADIRARAYDVLARLVPSKFGTHKEVGDDDENATRLALAEFSGPLQSLVHDRSDTFGLKASLVTADHCPELTGTLFAVAFARLPTAAIKPFQRTWILRFLLPWCDNVVLGEKGKINLDEFSSQAFFDNVFTAFTIEMTQDDKRVPQEVVVLWQRLALASKANLHQVIKFLMRRSVGEVDSLDAIICRQIVLHLYRSKPERSLVPLLQPLSFSAIVTVADNYGWARNSVADLKQEAIDPSKKANDVASSAESEGKTAPSSDARVQDAYAARGAAVAILADLVSEDINPLKSSLARLVNWSILRLNASEGKVLSRLLVAICRAIIHLHRQVNAESEHISDMNTLISCLENPHFRLRWNFNKYGKDANWSSKVIDTSLSVSQEAKDSDPAVHLKRDSKSLHVGTVVTVLCAAMKRVLPESIDQWGDESIQWGCKYKDTRMSMMAVQMYRFVPSPLTTERFTGLLQALLASVQGVEDGLEKTIEAAKSGNAKRDDPALVLSRGKAIEVMLTFQRLTSSPAASNVLGYVFWSAAVFLGLPHQPFTQLYHQALQVLQALDVNGYFLNLSPGEFDTQKQFIEKEQGYEFKGLQPLLYPALGARAMHRLGSGMYLALLNVKVDAIVDSSPVRHALTLLALLPWLHSQFTAERVDVTNEDLPTLVSINVAKGLATSPFNAPKSIEALTNCRDLDPDEFLSVIAVELAEKCLPEHADTFADLLSLIAKHDPSLSVSVLAVVRSFLGQPTANKFVDSFSDLLRVGVTKVTTSYQASTELLEVAMHTLVPMASPLNNVDNVNPLIAPQSAPAALRTSSNLLKRIIKSTGTGTLVPQTARQPQLTTLTPREVKPEGKRVKKEKKKHRSSSTATSKHRRSGKKSGKTSSSSSSSSSSSDDKHGASRSSKPRSSSVSANKASPRTSAPTTAAVAPQSSGGDDSETASYSGASDEEDIDFGWGTPNVPASKAPAPPPHDGTASGSSDGEFVEDWDVEEEVMQESQREALDDVDNLTLMAATLGDIGGGGGQANNDSVNLDSYIESVQNLQAPEEDFGDLQGALDALGSYM
eukprot:TRINITY_DN325_c0_g5_i1.p1 TRINITY_DN325_c0_g5~~TRINITY_DN325_c0_g5_i1.p1  ORF type:complete len:2421 (+),score=682.71 TRINITY_DN325_c0_g5_i1:135-7397(+)